MPASRFRKAGASWAAATRKGLFIVTSYNLIPRVIFYDDRQIF
jgi:hypothetical protein